MSEPNSLRPALRTVNVVMSGSTVIGAVAVARNDAGARIAMTPSSNVVDIAAR